MQTSKTLRLAEAAAKNEASILSAWLKYQSSQLSGKPELIKEAALKQTCSEFLALFVEAAQIEPVDTQAPTWRKVREMLTNLSSARALQGFTPSETAMFVFSLKHPLFEALRSSVKDASDLADELVAADNLLDRLGLFTTEIYQRSREDVIKRQQKEMLELSTPVFRLWDKVLALPLIGTLDSQRTQLIMEALLTQIVDTGSKVAILDITGVPTVDTETAQHLIKTVSAARLMGADCIISGIRPQIAQTIVHLGIDILDVTTTATMADAVAEALRIVGFEITRGQNGHR
jgi:rsbT co-antagonist protein RsbR